MPSVRAHVPAYQHHKATGQARVTLGGRDVYLGTYGSPESRERYDRLIAEWLAAGRRLELVPSRRPAQGRTTVNEHRKGYYQKEGEATKALPNIRTALRRLRQLYGRMAVEEFGPGALGLPPFSDPASMRVPMGHGLAQETLEDEADKAHTRADHHQAA